MAQVELRLSSKVQKETGMSEMFESNRDVDMSSDWLQLVCDKFSNPDKFLIKKEGKKSRYWVLRDNYDNLHDAIENLLLAPEGTLYDEPSKLLHDEMHDTVQASSILSFIGNGANKLSEIAF